MAAAAKGLGRSRDARLAGFDRRGASVSEVTSLIHKQAVFEMEHVVS